MHLILMCNALPATYVLDQCDNLVTPEAIAFHNKNKFMARWLHQFKTKTYTHHDVYKRTSFNKACSIS